MTDTAPATFAAGDKNLEFAVIPATEGNDGYDISALLKETGNVTLDVGFVNTASCKSAITYIDGDAGILRYRGYPIDQLAEKFTYVIVDTPALSHGVDAQVAARACAAALIIGRQNHSKLSELRGLRDALDEARIATVGVLLNVH